MPTTTAPPAPTARRRRRLARSAPGWLSAALRRALFSAQGRRPPLAPELAWAAWLAFLYDLLVGATPLQVRTAIANGFAVLRLERAWGLAGERALNRLLVGAPALKALAAYYYDNAHFIVTFGLLALLWWRRPAAYRPLRTTLVLVNLVAFCVFYLFPMAPPRLLPGAGFYDVVAESGAIGQWHTGSLARSADQYAAMPSLHIAWAVWSAAAIWALTDRRRFSIRRSPRSTSWQRPTTCSSTALPAWQRWALQTPCETPLVRLLL